MRFAVAPLACSAVSTALLDEAATLTGALATLAKRHPDYECLVILDRTGTEQRLSLGRLWARAAQYTGRLADRGVGVGEVVPIILPTGGELLAAYVGVMLAGAVPGLLAGPSNRFAEPAAYAAHVRGLVGRAGARTLCCEPRLAHLLGAEAGAVRPLTPDEVDGAAAPVPAITARPDDLATVQYSSGSTGIPKGVLLTHRAMLNNIRAVRDGLGLTPADVSVNWIPLYHDMGLIDAFLLPLLTGCPTVLIPTTDFLRDPSLWLWAIDTYRGAISWAPNFAYTLCAKRVPDADLAGLDLSSWRIAINAAEPVLASTIAAFTSRFAAHGFRPDAMTPAWGLAENVTIATAHPVASPPRIETIDRRALASGGMARALPDGEDGLPSVAIGRCLPHCAVEIRDGARRLPERQVGTVWLRSNSLFAGYHGDGARTAEVLVDGWLNTGDRGYAVGGDLFFIAREKDLLVIGGEKYAPHDLEIVINRVPGVREGCVVVFGVLNDERGTEDIVAVAETHETDAAARAALGDAIRHAVTRATGLGLRQVLVVPPGGVQKTTSGKLARSATRQRYAAALADTTMEADHS